MTASINGTTGVTFPDASVQATAATGFGFKNRIINGAMMIDQRNAGASVTLTSGTPGYAVDRTIGFFNVTGAGASIQQSTTAPTGFVNSLVYTAVTGASSGASELAYIRQRVEGLNISDLAWGSASASAITISFWARSSLTGTFSGAIRNSANNYCYVFTYTISSANTFEYKTVTIAGPTSGTWLTTNGVGLQLVFDMGCGSSMRTTAGSWASGDYYGATGAVSLIGTSGATFYITGVQLEKGSTATSFDYRPYGTELALCQRYCWVVGGSNAYQRFGSGLNYTTVQNVAMVLFPVTMRTGPSLTYSSVSDFSLWTAGSATVAATELGLDHTTPVYYGLYTGVASGLTAGGYAMSMAKNTTAARLTFSAEL